MVSSVEVAQKTLQLCYWWVADTWRPSPRPECPLQWASCMHRAKPSFSQLALWTHTQVWEEEEQKSRSGEHQIENLQGVW